jgi:signal recognition particle GTPase
MMTKTNDANTQLILHEIQNVSRRISDLPTKSDVRVAVMEGIQKHEDRCDARGLPVKVAENTQQIKTVTGDRLRRSIAPAARTLRLNKVPPIVWKLILIIGIGIAGKFGWDGSADVIRILTGPQSASAGEVEK